MDRKRAIEVLEIYNEWRQGADIPCPEPKTLTYTIDFVLEYLKYDEKN